MTRNEETLGGAAPGGIPGTSSNLPNAKAPAPEKSDATEPELEIGERHLRRE